MWLIGTNLNWADEANPDPDAASRTRVSGVPLNPLAFDSSTRSVALVPSCPVSGFRIRMRRVAGRL